MKQLDAGGWCHKTHTIEHIHTRLSPHLTGADEEGLVEDGAEDERGVG